MDDIFQAVNMAFVLFLQLDADLFEIMILSLKVSLSALFIATIIAMPIGSAVAVYRFSGRKAVIISLNILMGLPPVVVGLFVYLMLSRNGPFGVFGLLFTPTAMIIAQVILITPIIAALTRQVTEELYNEYDEQLISLGASQFRRFTAVLFDARYKLLTAILAGFGRASAEVGAVMIVGGNIDHVTRVMTTSIAMEASKGELATAIGLGLILITMAAIINLLIYFIGDMAQKYGNI